MKSLLPLIITLSLTSAFAADPKALSQADIAAAQARATSLANIARTASPVISDTGEIQIDPATGKPKQAAPGTAQAKDQSRYFNSVTGVTDYSNTAEPAKGGTAASKVNASGYGDLACTAAKGSRKSILGRVLSFGGCTYDSGNNIVAVTLSMCSTALKGGACADSDFTPPSSYPVGQYSTIDGVTLGLGCNASTKVCRVTLRDSFALTATGASLTTQAAAKTTENGANSAQGNIAATYTSPEYADKMATTGVAIDECVGGISKSAGTTGTAATCDSKKSSNFTGKTVGGTPQCSTTPICVRKATKTTNYTTSCSRNFPVTGYSCNFTVPKQDCVVTQNISTKATTSSCASIDMSGSVKVESTEATPVCTSNDPVTKACTTQTWNEYYTFPAKASLSGSCSASPLPLSGPPTTACINHGAGNVVDCQAGGWYQRTLSDQECMVANTSKDANGNVVDSIGQLTNAQKAGCGVCVAPITSDTCYAQVSASSNSCGNVDMSKCSLASSQAESSYMGLTLSQQETYNCSTTEESCVEYDRSNMCTNTDLAAGMDSPKATQKTSQNSSEAIASAAVIDAIARGAEQTADPFVPRVFNGTDSRCHRPTGFFSSLTADDCCRTDLARPTGNSDDKCSMDEFKLSAARLANQTVYLGQYCSKTRGFGPFKTCVQDTQTYCAFPGILARVIQSQGRDQLAAMANSSFGSTIQAAPLKFNFYNGAGGWNPSAVVNGVTLASWSYPAYCSDAEKATQAMNANPNALACPIVLTQYFAVCDDPNGCGTLPETPEVGAGKWLVSSVDPLKNITTAVSRYSVVAGACDPASTNCNYQVTAWPAGVGGMAVVSKEMNFPLYASQPLDAKALSVPEDLTSVGDFVFRPNAVAGAANPSAPLPPSILLDYSIDGGTTFLHANIPTKIDGTDYILPNTADVRITGGCDMASNTCQYRVTGTATVTAKPWGSAKQPDCTGFTLGQLAVLDFSKMDLSEWLASVTGSINLPDSANLGSVAATRAQQLLAAHNSGGVTTAVNPTAVTAATIKPAQEFGPYTATVKVTGNWPETSTDAAKNTDPVTGVDIDWGDCTGRDTASPVNEYVNGIPARGFTGQHLYPAPSKVAPACGGGPNNIAHAVKLTIYSTSGTHELTLKTVNLWNSYTNVGNGVSVGGGTVNTTATAPAR